jgi:hypothetical protein
MGVQINKARGYHKTFGINDPPGAITDGTDCRDTSSLNAHIPFEPGITGAIHDSPATNHNVVNGFLSPQKIAPCPHPGQGHSKGHQHHSKSKIFHDFSSPETVKQKTLW